MAKNLDIIMLFDFYKPMLTEKQADVIDLYYNEDLSLGEIASNYDISRQGVRDSIKRGENILIQTEERLGLVEKFTKVNKIKLRIKRQISDIKCEASYIEAPWVDKYLNNIDKLLDSIE